MGLTPAFEIIVNDQDISAALQQRLISLRVTDQSGWESDTLEIILADSDPLKPLALPKTGAELKVKLGYVGELHNLGTYIVDALELSGPPNQLSIKAKAAPQAPSPKGKTSLSTQKTRSWETGITLQAMVSKIANEHGLQPAVGESLKTQKLPHIDQVNESDINLLTRVCKEINALVKPAAEKLVVVKRGEAKSTRGQPLKSITLNASDISEWRLSIQQREVPQSVIATYRNLEQAKDVEVVVGVGEPIKRLKHPYPNAASATEAAQAELDKGQRSEQSLSISLPEDPTYEQNADSK
jgi:phage protein D